MTAVKHAIEALSHEMQTDPDIAWGWHCNIAMPIMDVLDCSHKDANEAAAHLMQRLFGVDITQHEQYIYDKSAAQEYAEMRIAAEREEDAATPSDLADEAGI